MEPRLPALPLVVTVSQGRARSLTALLPDLGQSPPAVILEPPKIKSLTVSIVSPSICHEVMESDAMIFVFGMFSFMHGKDYL